MLQGILIILQAIKFYSKWSYFKNLNYLCSISFCFFNFLFNYREEF